jgi:hypothetical protein
MANSLLRNVSPFPLNYEIPNKTQNRIKGTGILCIFKSATTWVKK